MKPTSLRWLAPLLLAASGLAVSGVPEEFIAPDDFLQLKISPDGEHYAATTPLEGRTALVILRRADMKVSAQLVPESEQHVVDFDWANSRQVVFSVAVQAGALAAPQRTGMLFSLDTGGGKAARIGSDTLYLVDALPADPDHILVEHWVGGRGRVPVSRLNLATGRVESKHFKEPPLRSLSYHVDNAGEIRFASGYAFSELRRRIYRREPSGEWTQIHSEADGEFDTYVLGFSADNRTAYLAVEQAERADAVVAYDMASGEAREVARHPRADVGRTLHSPVDGAVIALEFHDGPPSLHPILPEDPFVQHLQRVSKAFPGSYVTPTSYTLDGGTGIYLVSSDVNSGEFYRFEHATGKATFLTARNQRLDPERMAPMTPVLVPARDGLELRAFVTRPPGAAGPGPLVVIPHGGPKGIFDRWGFDAQTQMLASRGYAVMQVNFRGSGNYGRAFREAGNGQWGAKMQDDLTDATRWALDQGIAAPGKVCVYGASYGAYAALMALAREPELYACAIGNVGVYDLDRMYRSERSSRVAKDYYDTALGDVDLAAISPTRLAGRIRGPVLMGAGELDGVAPVWQTRAMESALKEAGRPPQVVVYPREAHGYYRLANRRDWGGRVLDFLDKHIGPAAGRP